MEYPNSLGKLIVVEGIDGSGKGTQVDKLASRLAAEGISVKKFAFPMYEQHHFGKLVGRYLDGQFGALENIHPWLASILYAGDRFEAYLDLAMALRTHQVVLCDRYVQSNLAHQGARVPPGDRLDFIVELAKIEHGVFKTPVADLVLWVDMPVAAAANFVRMKQARPYTNKANDIHEENADYQHAVSTTYNLLYQQGTNVERIPCLIPGDRTNPSRIASLEDIHQEMWAAVLRRFPELQKKK